MTLAPAGVDSTVSSPVAEGESRAVIDPRVHRPPTIRTEMTRRVAAASTGQRRRAASTGPGGTGLAGASRGMTGWRASVAPASGAVAAGAGSGKNSVDASNRGGGHCTIGGAAAPPTLGGSGIGGKGGTDGGNATGGGRSGPARGVAEGGNGGPVATWEAGVGGHAGPLSGLRSGGGGLEAVGTAAPDPGWLFAGAGGAGAASSPRSEPNADRSNRVSRSSICGSSSSASAAASSEGTPRFGPFALNALSAPVHAIAAARAARRRMDSGSPRRPRLRPRAGSGPPRFRSRGRPTKRPRA